MYVRLLVAGDVKRHNGQHNFRPHALYSSSYSQIQLTTEGELWSGAQVCQGLQGLSMKRHRESNLSFDYVIIPLHANLTLRFVTRWSVEVCHCTLVMMG